MTRIEFDYHQESREDPWLCDWAEFYFLAYMSHRFLKGGVPELIKGEAIVEGESRPLILLQKHDAIDVFYDEWESPQNVNLGVESALILEGKGMEDTIMIRTRNGFRSGRLIDRNFGRIDILMSNVRFEDHSNLEYLEAAYGEMRQAMEELGVSTYTELYQSLKANILNL